jgi:hypothetical protein
MWREFCRRIFLQAARLLPVMRSEAGAYPRPSLARRSIGRGSSLSLEGQGWPKSTAKGSPKGACLDGMHEWVFTVPKRLRVYFRFTRSYLGDLCRAAYDTVREVMRLESGEPDCIPAMIGAVQTHGDVTNWHPHIHAVCAAGVFCKDGRFEPVDHINRERAVEIFRDKVFDFLFDAGLLNLDDIESMMSWRHSGFSIDTSVRIEADDRAGMQRLIEYISRCPFSLGRMVKLTDDGKVMYRAVHADCIRFPQLGKEMDLRPGMRRQNAEDIAVTTRRVEIHYIWERQ